MLEDLDDWWLSRALMPYVISWYRFDDERMRRHDELADGTRIQPTLAKLRELYGRESQRIERMKKLSHIFVTPGYSVFKNDAMSCLLTMNTQLSENQPWPQPTWSGLCAIDLTPIPSPAPCSLLNSWQADARQARFIAMI
ncbi:hypothetical protein LIA77_01124 [Sarocladium implicatum]|jgi:hypothetical protein|nr:hypothetical protein LIA77_01124 [Sarocladium implicatum]